MMCATMLASTTAEPIAQPEITIPQPTAANRKRRKAIDARHSRGSNGAREAPVLRKGASSDLSAQGSVQLRSAAGKPNTSILGR
jgi:hypothetical protein